MKMHLPPPSINYRPDPMTGEEKVKVLEVYLFLSHTECTYYKKTKNLIFIYCNLCFSSWRLLWINHLLVNCLIHVRTQRLPP
jgi:hypothetical protein